MPEDSLLGRSTAYPSKYSPELLVSIPRAAERSRLGLGAELPFAGVDIWTAYELSWLDSSGKPSVALGEIRFPAETANIVESKSLKLYLNSLNGVSFAAQGDAPRSLIEHDLSEAASGPVSVAIGPVTEPVGAGYVELPGECIDTLEVEVSDYEIDPELLRLRSGLGRVTETLHSHLFKTNCPVTAQPDWASILVRYHGAAIDHRSLLLYLISYRNHAAFHEHCVERIFVDLLDRCDPQQLTVYARYTRRGGLDINPFRSNFEPEPRNLRLWRQ